MVRHGSCSAAVAFAVLVASCGSEGTTRSAGVVTGADGSGFAGGGGTPDAGTAAEADVAAGPADVSGDDPTADSAPDIGPWDIAATPDAAQLPDGTPAADSTPSPDTITPQDTRGADDAMPDASPTDTAAAPDTACAACAADSADSPDTADTADTAPPICPAAGVPCSDTYPEQQVCPATGKVASVTCHKLGTCTGPGDGTACSWGPGSYCTDPCLPSALDGATIFGLHSWSPGAGAALSGKKGWAVQTVVAWDPPDVAAYEALQTEGFLGITRLNHGYGGAGTVPLDPGQLDAFAKACASHAAALGSLSPVYIIGNEMNLPWEGDGTTGVGIEHYVAAFVKSRAAIKAAWPQAIVLLGPVAPWSPTMGCAAGPYNPVTEAWKNYLHCLVAAVGDGADGYSIHTYGGRDGDGDPSDDGEWGFGVFESQIAVIDGAFPNQKPVFITETNHGADGSVALGPEMFPLHAYVQGYIPKSWQRIHEWNQANGCRIRALAWFTWNQPGWAGYNLTHPSLATALADFNWMTATWGWSCP